MIYLVSLHFSFISESSSFLFKESCTNKRLGNHKEMMYRNNWYSIYRGIYFLCYDDTIDLFYSQIEIFDQNTKFQRSINNVSVRSRKYFHIFVYKECVEQASLSLNNTFESRIQYLKSKRKIEITFCSFL